jgi:hypothetical protein
MIVGSAEMENVVTFNTDPSVVRNDVTLDAAASPLMASCPF